MSGSDNVLRPSADLAREKTEASIKANKQSGKTNKSKDASVIKAAGANCDAAKKMVSFENEIHNTSPNASNINHG